ncbi:hypothetical protein BJ138DRAFT_1116447 [Hygrophoropsis aurantiaca]|uniref:Uncharacterized protein n=1 Tax=Hygrophoropsis aurantiaca TaxID=72124 RepID=A0ACB8A3U4_9AGAM|nr:hypothetical protein BJ138DRAFT_1116447 [Hygrophoropsis aurantiaca]
MATLPGYDFSAEEPELYGRQHRTPRVTERMQAYLAERERQNAPRQVQPHTPTTPNQLFTGNQTNNGPDSTAAGETAGYATYTDMNHYAPPDCFAQNNGTVSSIGNQQWSQHQPNFFDSNENSELGARTAQMVPPGPPTAMTQMVPPAMAREPDRQDQWNPNPGLEMDADDTDQQPGLDTPSANASSRSLTFAPGGRKPKRRFFASEKELPGAPVLLRINDSSTAPPSESASAPNSPTPGHFGKENHPVNTSNNICGSKRIHDADSVAGEDTTPPRSKALKTNRNKATESDLAPMELKICKRAYPYHRVLLSMENPLPDPETTAAEMLAIKAYSMALGELSATINPELLSTFKDPSETIINILSQRGSTLRGKVVTAAKNLVAAMYNIGKPCAENDTAGVNRIRKYITSLIGRGAYVYKNPLTRSGGLYGHPIILEILCRVWFKEKNKSDGIRYAETYLNVNGKGIPLVTIALITTAVRCALDEWVQGTYSETHFKCDRYLKIFQKELQTLRDWDKYTTNTGSHLTTKLRVELFEKARAYAGATVNADVQDATMGADDFAANESQF